MSTEPKRAIAHEIIFKFQEDRLVPRGECYLYTDTWVMNNCENCGPFDFINSMHWGAKGTLRPAIVLRVAYHFEARSVSMNLKDDYANYHGGDLFDEVAAIASLILGIRLEAGPINRQFRLNDKKFGEPVFMSSKEEPFLYKGSGAPPHIPRLETGCNLNQLGSILDLEKCSAAFGIAFIRAARLYQRALWLAEADSATSWVLLVSAIEVAANQKATLQASDVATFKQVMPDLYNWVKRCKNLSAISAFMSKYTKATQKFINFLIDFCPSPPERRPHVAAQLTYSKKNLKAVLGRVYDHRSNQLHEGVPMPAPMCAAPYAINDDIPVEVPTSLAVTAYDSTWEKKTTPMFLHTFEHLVRGALINWFKQETLVATGKPCNGPMS